ncbi:Anthranilate phosphoribosyltransferase [Sulfurovum sp. enrichment culture clone C5]|uniref:Anthranilate phosphoribosyltransferase n=1 Tax=Sulfurovum sp. enrichment culture clone C5 TaxID=497650 RepID=A0A0S4XQE6_9BACT|nr:Anthranilate phosphoribosyltransferase [Sulfurovum sp. enrichment culture clone C5]
MLTQVNFEKLFANEMSEEEAREFLIALYENGESSSDLAIAARVMKGYSKELIIPDELRGKAIDIVGTGGDKSGTFNISSATSLLLASMGCYVAKHGNRSITSNSGSADVLEKLGINLNLTTEQQALMLENVGFCFMFAPNHHPAMKHITPVRHSIPHRTIFNLLGPLTNPANVKKYLIGVSEPKFIDIVANALVDLGIKRAMVVSSIDNVDEISISTKTKFAFVEDNFVSHGEIDPIELGFKQYESSEVLGGNSEINAGIIRDVFSGKEKGAKRDIIVINAAFALFIEGSAIDLKDGIQKANAALDSKKAMSHLEKIIEFSNSFK